VRRRDTSGIVPLAPRISPRLLVALERLDDETVPIAEISRRVGAEAERLGLHRPSYQRVRVLVHELRASRRRRGPSTARVLLEISTRARPPEALLDHVSGIGVREL
jgi:hypothetical protein